MKESPLIADFSKFMFGKQLELTSQISLNSSLELDIQPEVSVSGEDFQIKINNIKVQVEGRLRKEISEEAETRRKRDLDKHSEEIKKLKDENAKKDEEIKKEHEETEKERKNLEEARKEN